MSSSPELGEAGERQGKPQLVAKGRKRCRSSGSSPESPQANEIPIDQELREAGGKDSHPYIHMPVGFSKLTAGPRTWGFNTVPQKYANNREIPYAQGKVLGGGRLINFHILNFIDRLIGKGYRLIGKKIGIIIR